MASPEKVEAVRLKRQIGLLQGVAVVTGLIIGSGIFISPKGVLMYTQSVGLSLVFWVLGGVLSLFGALTFAEVGVVIPLSGAYYSYLNEMYGSFAAFSYAWCYLWFVRTGANAVKCILFGRYILKPFFPDCDVSELSVLLLATVMAVCLTVVNCVSVKLAMRGQTAMAICSMCTVALLAGCGVVWIAQGKTEHLSNAFEGSTLNAGDYALGINATIFSYYGWIALNFLVEELKNPSRNLPLSIIISVLLVTALYLMVNVAYLAILGKEGVLDSQAVAMSVALKTMGPVAWVMSILIAVTSCSSFNSGMMVGSRLAFTASRNGHLPRMLALINIQYFTPMMALFIQGLVILLFIWTVEVYSIINRVMFINLFFDIVTVAGFLRMRMEMRKKNLSSPLKLPLAVPIVYFIVILFLVIVQLVYKPRESALGMALMFGTGIPYYLVAVSWKHKPATLIAKLDRWTVIIQKLFLSIPQEAE